MSTFLSGEGSGLWCYKKGDHEADRHSDDDEFDNKRKVLVVVLILFLRFIHCFFFEKIELE